MFASYEVATSFPSLTAIKGYDLDKSSDVPLMGHFMLFTKIRLLLKKLNPAVQMELALWFSWFFLSLNTGGVTNILVYSCFESLF